MRFQEAFDPIRSIGESWRLVRRAPVPLLVGGVLLFLLTDGETSNDVRIAFEGRRHVAWPDLPRLMLEALVGSACLAWQLVVLLFVVFLWSGFPRVVERVATEGESLLAEVFSPRGRFGPLLVTLLLSAVVVLGALLPSALLVGGVELVGEWFGLEWLARVLQGAVVLVTIPLFVYVLLGIYLAQQAVVLDGLAPVEALKRSWAIAEGNRWWLLLYIVVMHVFQLLGLLLCCVGVLGTGALRAIAINDSYLRLVRTDEEQARWWIERASAPRPGSAE